MRYSRKQQCSITIIRIRFWNGVHLVDEVRMMIHVVQNVFKPEAAFSYKMPLLNCRFQFIRSYI